MVVLLFLEKTWCHCTQTFLLTVFILFFWLAEVFRWPAAWCPLCFDISCVLHCTLWLCSFLVHGFYSLCLPLLYTVVEFWEFLFLLTFLFVCELCTHLFSIFFFLFFSLFFLDDCHSVWRQCSFGWFFSAWKEPDLELSTPTTHPCSMHHITSPPSLQYLIWFIPLCCCFVFWCGLLP